MNEHIPKDLKTALWDAEWLSMRELNPKEGHVLVEEVLRQAREILITVLGEAGAAHMLRAAANAIEEGD